MSVYEGTLFQYNIVYFEVRAIIVYAYLSNGTKRNADV